MNRNLVILSTIAVLLGAYAAGDWLTGGRSLTGGGSGSETQSPAKPTAAEPAQGTAAKLNPLEGLSADSFSAVMEKPLFNPGRAPRPPDPPPPPPPPEAPPPPETPQEAPAPKPEDYALLAVAGGPSGFVAAVRLSATGEVLYLRQGQPVGEWTVVSVGDRSVVIGTPENNVTLNLFESNGADAAAPPVQEVPPTPPEDTPPAQPPEDSPQPAEPGQ